MNLRWISMNDTQFAIWASKWDGLELYVVSWVRCGTWLYPFLIFAAFPTYFSAYRIVEHYNVHEYFFFYFHKQRQKLVKTNFT